MTWPRPLTARGSDHHVDSRGKREEPLPPSRGCRDNENLTTSHSALPTTDDANVSQEERRRSNKSTRLPHKETLLTGSSTLLLVHFRSVTQSCPTLCDPMNRSTPGLPVHHQLPEFTQTRVHRVGDAIQSSHPLSSPSPPALNLSQHQGLFK